ncbi:hypothetical protein BJP27_24345 (plasmid) [Pseudomonas oryzihabitans]|nr:hypothetical protein BJP27_24345 [Pseudomonas psychrotolerans]
MEIILVKTLDGALRPATEEGIEQLQKLKVGAGVRCEVKQVRNYRFLQKTMVLFKVAYNHWVENNLQLLEYKGEKVLPCINRFRKDLIIVAGHYEATYDLNNKVRLTAKSLSYANCSEEEAQAIYSSVIDAILARVYRGQMDERRLQEQVDQIIRFT